MDNTNAIKIAVAAAMAALMTYLQQLLIPMILLVVVMALDYITGVHAAWVHNELNPQIGLFGFLKKFAYLTLVAVAAVIDYIIGLLGAQVGITIGVQFVALLMVFWLLVNELISILENIQEIGAPVPPFIGGLLNHLRGKVEEALPELPEEPEKGKHER